MSPARKADSHALIAVTLLGQISRHYTRTMESLIRNVDDLSAHDRQALERVLGRSLREDQQLIIHIVNLSDQPEASDASPNQQGSDASILPEWCQVYKGLTGTAIADLEQIILQRADFSRHGEKLGD
ncbi:MAG: hypothetical protein JWN70_5060 [Planctomycetaceae bacterium]|nr:hypothetical protein [Planctomycetaceae bacterium]